MSRGWFGNKHKHMLASKGIKVSDWEMSKSDWHKGKLELSGVELVRIGDDFDLEEEYKIVTNEETINDPYINEFYDALEKITKENGFTFEIYNTESAPDYAGYKTDGHFDWCDFVILMIDEDGWRLESKLMKELERNKIDGIFLEMISDYTIGIKVESKPESQRKKYKKEGQTMSDRITNLRDVLGDVPYRSSEVKQGKHYSEVASSLWADEYLPTVIQWNHGAIDDFKDRNKSFENMKLALEYERRNK